MSKRRVARVTVDGTEDLLATVREYLPGNYRARMSGGEIVISGLDEAGWTLDGYVLPRLASALIPASETEPTAEDVETEPTAEDVIRGLLDALDSVCEIVYPHGVQTDGDPDMPEGMAEDVAIALEWLRRNGGES